ncbi:septum formation family protein [Rhodococcus sp. NPDC060090]|uniref:septum formation family protein n=1 Tax=Rhodococcus sp. NPDC060090 TaxID=3347056 RepID=UPI0036473B08
MAEDKKKKPVRRPPSAELTRRALVFVAAGAILAAIATFVVAGFEGTDTTDGNTSGASPSTGAVAGDAFGTSTSGDCLTWTALDASDLAKVECEQTHLFEVVEDIDLSVFPGSEWGPGSRFPSVLRFTELRDEMCAPAAMDYLGGRFDPHGKFSVGLINPGEAGWAAGERTLRCGLQFSSTTGNLLPINGRVADQDQSRAWDVGLCIGINNGVPADPVECSKPHAFEVVATVDLSENFPGGLPGVEDQDAYLERTCTERVNEYLGNPDALRNKTLTLFWDNLNFDSWLAGSRKVNCSVGKQVEGGGFASITGSAKGDILIDGQPPVAPPPQPDGRSLPIPLPGAAPLPGS